MESIFYKLALISHIKSLQYVQTTHQTTRPSDLNKHFQIMIEIEEVLANVSSGEGRYGAVSLESKEAFNDAK